MKVSGAESLIRDLQERWISGHLYYHQSLDLAVRGFVHPLVVSLVTDGQIDAFFFLRYNLGGPHVRLRLQVVPGAREDVLRAMQAWARRFLNREPSSRSLDDEVIRRWNESILANDRHEVDDSVYPDNSFHVMAFRPEIERYGGPERFRASLDFFTLSSVAVLEHLSKYGETSRAAQLAYACRLLLRQALGFAVDEKELFDLLGYGVSWWGERMPKVVAKGDKVAQSRMDFFVQLLRESLSEVRDLGNEREPSNRASQLLIAGSGRLSGASRTADRVTRARIGASQLHMTASRVGLTNAEEVYLSGLLTSTLRELRATAGEELSRLGETLAERAAEEPATTVGDLVSSALAALAEAPARRLALEPSV